MRLLVRFMGFLFAAGTVLFLVGVGAVAGLIWHFSKDLPDYSQLQDYEPPVMTRIHAHDGQLIAEYGRERRIFVPINAVPKLVIHAFLSAEDKRFYEHAGIDVQGMARAAINTVVGQKEGASTLTQQYVKNVLIEAALAIPDPAQRAQALADARDNSGASGMARKLREAKLAIALEKTTPKQTILEGYLNIAQFGINIYGIESAANHYFGKHASELNYLEAATLAGVTQSPTKWDPAKNTAESETRRNVVLRLFGRAGILHARAL